MKYLKRFNESIQTETEINREGIIDYLSSVGYETSRLEVMGDLELMQLWNEYTAENPEAENIIAPIEESKMNEAKGDLIPLRVYFEDRFLKHEDILNMKVVDADGDGWYITLIDPMVEETKLPWQVFCSDKEGSDTGYMIDVDELFVKNDVE